MRVDPDKVELRSKDLRVQIKLKGAELCSVQDRDSGFEYMWQAGENWPRHAPNLFPVIGSLLDHEYSWQGTTYPLRHHGFARDNHFTLLQQSEHSASFLLEPNQEIRECYPFQFQLLISYVLCENVLEQRYRVINKGNGSLPFSIGGHPAFKVSGQSNYIVEFEHAEEIPSMRLQGPYVSEEQIEVMKAGIIELSPEIFEGDALMFKGLRSQRLRLKHRENDHAVEVQIKDWPYLGIWAKPGEDFVCIEPWEGLADRLTHNKDIALKEGIRILEPGKSYTNKFSMKFQRP